MQPGYPGQDPYGQQPQQPNDPTSSPHSDPYGQPQSPYSPPAPGAPAYGQPAPGQPAPGAPAYGQQPYQDPYAQQPVPGQPYPAPGYQPGYGAAGQPQKNNTLGLIGMITGIASIVLAICCPFIGIPAAIAGVVLGFLGKNKAEQGLADNRGQALTGLICGGVGVVLGIANAILGVALNTGGGFDF